MKVVAVRTKLFRENDDLVSFITCHIPRISENTVLVITSKILALAEGRTAPITRKVELIKKESTFALKTKYTWLTVKDGMVMAAAGIDESNADGKLILLPRDSFTSARELHRILKKHYRVKKLGVLITDSRVLPLRAGVVGLALGYAGFVGIRDYRGKKDLSGRVLKISRTDVADCLASAAVLEMGEGSERRPLALITDAPIVFRARIDTKELHIPIEDDMYKPLFAKSLSV